jgi:hypothetical protein
MSAAARRAFSAGSGETLPKPLRGGGGPKFQSIGIQHSSFVIDTV